MQTIKAREARLLAAAKVDSGLGRDVRKRRSRVEDAPVDKSPSAMRPGE
jgi:hypothetical protein